MQTTASLTVPRSERKEKFFNFCFDVSQSMTTEIFVLSLSHNFSSTRAVNVDFCSNDKKSRHVYGLKKELTICGGVNEKMDLCYGLIE